MDKINVVNATEFLIEYCKKIDHFHIMIIWKEILLKH